MLRATLVGFALLCAVTAAPGSPVTLNAIAPGACNPGVIDIDCEYVDPGDNQTYHCKIWTGDGCVLDIE